MGNRSVLPGKTRFAGRIALFGAFMAASITPEPASAQRPGGYDPPHYSDGKPHFEKREETFGHFVVVRNIEDYRTAPIIHGPWLDEEARLGWHDSTGTIGFTFVDNGWQVSFKAEGRSSDGQTICLMGRILVGYDPAPSTLENWRKLQPFIQQQLRRCTAIAPENLNRAIAELQVSGADYVAAANAWKGVSKELFGPDGKRCIAERMRKPITMPPEFECVQYSAP